MIKDSALIKLAQKYDDFDAEDELLVFDKEEYAKCMADPDCRARYTERAAARQRRRRERTKLDPTLDTARRERSYIEQDTAAKKVLRESGSLDGFAYKMGQQIADIKRRVKNNLEKRNETPESSPAYQKIMLDIGELLHLRNKIVEFAQTLRLVEPGKPLAPESVQQLLAVESLCQSYSNKFAHYTGIVVTINEVLAKLKTIAVGLIN